MTSISKKMKGAEEEPDPFRLCFSSSYLVYPCIYVRIDELRARQVIAQPDPEDRRLAALGRRLGRPLFIS